MLLVEDEQSIVEPLAAALAREGFETSVAATAADALELAERTSPDVVLLDLMLPDGSGYDVCRELRRTSKVPIIMLTARGEEADRIVGLELGADDYVVKPFSARELVARMRAVLRRTEDAPEPPDSDELQAGAITVDLARRHATVEGRSRRALAQGVRPAGAACPRGGPRGDARAADRGGLGHDLVRLHEDPRRARERAPTEAR